MNQSSEHIDSIKPPIRTNKNFVYKGNKYPIDFSLVKKYSNYFYRNKSQFKSVSDIEIKPENYKICDEAIPMFVNCCQSKPFDINDSNVFSLHQLSIQYEVSVLNELSSQYINKNQKPLIFDTIFFKLQNRNSEVNFDISTEEELIASNFFEFINDERLLSLPIPVLFNIVNNEHLKMSSLNLQNQNQIIEFLFKCLDKHKRNASILFLHLDLENERVDLLTQLFSRYSDVFDFSFINSKFLAKNTSFLLSELQKLKTEFTIKLNEIDSENKKQREFFKSSLNSFNESKRSFERKMIQMEEKLSEQERKIEKYTNIKVTKIEINTEPDFLLCGSTITFSTLVKPKLAFNDDVEWRIIQEVEGSVEVKKMNEKSLVLKGLISGKKVTIVATALDGSGVIATKEIRIRKLKGSIEINVQQDQTIKGTIKIIEEREIKLDKSKSKYILNSNNSSILGKDAYENGFDLDNLIKKVSFNESPGQYYLHVLVVDNFDNSQELISNELIIRSKGFNNTENVQSVVLEPGSYKLEAWGAQGGSFDSTFHGGFGGYSTGIINLDSKTTLYVVVGNSTNSKSGGYNGGGSGGVYTVSSYTFTSFGGGGASHIGLKSGKLTDFSDDYSSNLLIVASGGGGATGTTHQSIKQYNSVGGCGGGITGSQGDCSSDNSSRSTGGTQNLGGKSNYYDWTESGSFGQGSNCAEHPHNHLGGGGGGGFYGGGSGGNSGGGAGGSGYINTSKLTDAFMYGYNAQTSSSAESKTYSTTNVSSDPISNYAKQNDGYVKITYV